MIRRKMWATATCCLALAAAAQAQTGSAPQATLGAPQPIAPGYIARGAAPTPGYPSFIPREYVAPTPPTYASSPAAARLLPAFAEQAQTGPSPSAQPMPPKAMPKDKAPATLGPLPSTAGEGTFAADTLPPTAPVTGTPMMGMPGSSAPLGCAPYLDDSCGAMPTCWFSAEYLRWQFRGVTVPPLVTAAPAGAPGTLDDARTVVLYGGPDILKDWTNGIRLRAGVWFEGGTSGLDVAFFNVGKLEESFVASSNGNPGLFRPFFNTALNAQDAQLVAFIDPVAGPVLAGAVSVFSQSELLGTELNYRTGFSTSMGGRIDLLCGYRYLRLKDTLDIQSNITTQAAAGAAPAGTRIFSSDHFEALSQFHGAQVGLVGEWDFGEVMISLRGTMAAGVTLQKVDISGASGSVTPAGATVGAAGGLLALPTNIGTHDNTRFAIAPQIGVTVGYQVTENVRVFAGYDFLYWTNVVRAGEQLDRFVNPNFIPDPTTGTSAKTGVGLPRYPHRDEYFYAHGCSVGIEFRW